MSKFAGLVSGTARLLVCGLALAALLGGAGRVHAQAGLKAELAEAAKKVAQAVGDRPVTVGEFSGPQRLQSSAGPGIAKALSDALKKQKVKVENNAALTVEGDFSDFNDDQSGRLAVRLNVRIKNNRGKVALEFARAIFPKDANDTTIQDLLGVSTSAPANASAEQRDDLIRASLKDPKATIDGTRVMARRNRPFAVEVLVKSGDDYVAKKPEEKVQGRAFVSLDRKDVYAVRLINTSKFDAAVTLNVDGLNVFSFSEVKDETGDPKVTRIIVPTNSQVTIKGWYLTNGKTASFEVTDLPKSAGGALKSSSAVGTITASFAVAVAKGDKLPSDEPKARAADPSATGLGTEVGLNYRETERVFGVVRDTISVRYGK
jgi:hypothetical protein